MNFLLSEEQLAFGEAVRGMLADKCPPLQLHRTFDGEATFDGALWSEICAMGIPAIAVDEEYGGLGLKLVDLALIAELLGEFAAPVPFLGHAVATLAVQLTADLEQKARWLPALASGEKLATIALAEGADDWVPDRWRMAGGARLTGAKRLVPAAAEADLIVVGTAEGFAVVEKEAGYFCSRLDSVDRTRRVDRVEFADTIAQVLPGDARLRTKVFDAAAVLLSADAFGGARRLTEMSVDYAKVRQQFDRPIGAFQALKHQLANMALEVEPSRGLYWFAAHAWDAIGGKASYAASQAKAHCAEVFLQTARDAVEAHGGIGFTWEHDVHIHLKRAMFDWSWLGQPEVHRLRAADLAGW